MKIKAIGMSKRWLKHSWFWIVRWFFLAGIGCIMIYGAYALFVKSGKENGFVPGALAGVLGFCGGYLIYLLMDYAVRRDKIMRKLKNHYEK